MLLRLCNPKREEENNILHVSQATLYWCEVPAKLASDQAVKPAVQADVERCDGRAVTTAEEAIPRKVMSCWAFILVFWGFLFCEGNVFL